MEGEAGLTRSGATRGSKGLSMSIKKEGGQGRCSTNRKFGVAGGQGFSMGMLAMSGAVEAAKLCEVVSDGAEVLQERWATKTYQL